MNLEKEGKQVYNTGLVVLLLVLGWISAFLSLFLYPFIFGTLGIILGITSSKIGNKAGLFLIVSSIIMMGIGLIFGSAILSFIRHSLNI